MLAGGLTIWPLGDFSQRMSALIGAAPRGIRCFQDDAVRCFPISSWEGFLICQTANAVRKMRLPHSVVAALEWWLASSRKAVHHLVV